MNEMRSVVNLLNEIGMLAHTERSGFAFLGNCKQSVAEHSYRMTLIAYVLASLIKKPIDLSKLLLICLLHDLPEARTGDLNHMNKRYVHADEEKVIEEIEKNSSLGPQLVKYLREYNENKTIEANLAHDADQIELLLVLKELDELGNSRAMSWYDPIVKRLHTEVAREIAETIRTTSSSSWWNNNKN